MIQWLKNFWNLLVKAAGEFISDNGIKLSASLSYYTIFSIGPVLIIIISLLGIFFGREAVQGKVFWQVKGVVGTEAAIQIQEIIQNIQRSQFSTSGVVIGIVLLILGATGVFTEIQDSINYIWSIKAKPKRGWLHYLINRVISFSLIIAIGFILLVSLIIHALFDLMQDRLTRLFDEVTVYVFLVLNYVTLFAFITLLFAIIFKILPDAKIRWKDAFVGASFTAVLFLVGKFLIGYYLAHSRIGLTFGTATSLVLILLWVYYTSIILFFGAEFTKMYTIDYGGGIEPDPIAVFIVKQETKELKKRTM